MPPGVIELFFDPVLRLSDTSSVRYETIGLAIVLLIGLVLAAWIAGRFPPAGTPEDAAPLRLDDLVFISVGVVPGAILGGRLGYVLDHLDYYRSNPEAMTDLAQGGLTLSLAVPLGILTGAAVARLLGAPVGRWMHVAAGPMLFVLAAGKLVGVLGATGQGALSDAAWATSYLGPGPWGSLAPHAPSHPSQVYEAVGVSVAIALLALLTRVRPFARPNGGALYLAMGLWAAVRFAVAGTWRDEPAVGPLRMDQALALAVLALAGVGLLERALASRRGIVSGTETKPVGPDRPTTEVPQQ